MDNNQNLPKESQDIRFVEPTFIDPLTGLFNQYYLFQFFPEEIKKAKLSNYPLSIFMLDLDGFKNINDTYGHLCGDEILKQLAAILKKSVRQTDTVIRYAGDEFTILLPTVDAKRAEMLSNQLIVSVDKNIFKGKKGEDLHLTMSVGFATCPDDSDQIDQLIDLADKALYLSKQKGKNRVSAAKEVNLEAVSYLVAMNSFPCAKFIDRQDEIDRLKQIFDTVVLKSNLLQVAFIVGESGTGKTRLLSELNNYVRDWSAVINCHSYIAHKQDPYYLFAKGISTYIEKIGVDNPGMNRLLSQMPPAELVELSRIIPALASVVRKPQGAVSNDKETRFLLFKGFLDFLIELNKAQPLVLSFDDIQWADKASLELIRYLSKEEKNKRIFIVCSYVEDKSQVSKKDKEFSNLCEDVSFNDNFTEIKLTNFSLEDASGMIEVIFPGIGVNKEFCELIYNSTQGNPSFVEEMLKSLVENAVIFYQDNQWQLKKGLSPKDIPTSLEGVIKNRLKNLDEETKEMIVQAAVIGEDFSVDLLKKIGNKDEGFILDLLSRAKKVRLVDELETKGNFGFINNNVQHMLYNELNDAQRSQLHYKVGQAITEEHKDNIYNVAGELNFHFSKVPERGKADEYSNSLLEKINQIFNPAEILEYLEKLAKEVTVEEEAAAPLLSDKLLDVALRFARSLQGAVKIFHLYPEGVMRNNTVKEAYTILSRLWEEAPRLNLGEVEKGLVINSRRISPKEITQGNVENFLSLLLEQNLKTVSFIKGLSQDEFYRFVQNLSLSSEEIREKGGWQKLIEKENITGIKVDLVHFVQVGGLSREFAEKKKIQDVMLLEFLMGKMDYGNIDKGALIRDMQEQPKKFAQTVMEASRKIIQEGGAVDEVKAITHTIEKISSQIFGQEPEQKEHAKDLAKVIMELKPALRNKIIRSQLFGEESKQKEIADNILNSVPDEVIVDMIIEEYKENQNNLLAVKDSLDKLAIDEDRKGRIREKIESELAKQGAVKQDATFVTGQINWEDLPLERRIDNLIRLPDKYYKSELGKIKTVLDELDSGENRQKLENFLYNLLIKADQVEPQVRKDLMRIITDFIKTPFLNDRLETQQMQTRLDGLWKRLKIELEPQVFSSLLEIFSEIIKEFTGKLQVTKNIILEIEKPMVKRYCLFVHQLLYLLLQRLKWEENRNEQVHKLIKDFIREISEPAFLEILFYSIVNNPSFKAFDLKDIFSIVGNHLVDILIDLETYKAIRWGDSFREYIVRKGIAGLLQELGEPALNIFKQRLSGMKDDVPVSLIELAGYLKNEELIDSLSPFLGHSDPLIRHAVILALADIATDASIEIISQVAREDKDKKVRILSKEQLRKLKKEK